MMKSMGMLGWDVHYSFLCYILAAFPLVCLLRQSLLCEGLLCLMVVSPHWNMCAASIHSLHENGDMWMLLQSEENTKVADVIIIFFEKVIKDIFRAAHHTHCHLSGLPCHCFHEDLLTEGPLLSWQQPRWMYELRNYCYSSLWPLFCFEVIFFNMFPELERIMSQCDFCHAAPYWWIAV